MRPADYVGITDPSIAFYFDVECTEALLEHEKAMEETRLEAMSMGMVSKQLGGATREVTQANFRDQGI